MCYGPHEHHQLMQEMERRTAALTVPRWRFAAPWGTIGTWLGDLLRPGPATDREGLQPVAVPRSRPDL